MPTTREECLDALREAAARLGKSTTKAEYEQLGLRPASATIIRQMGGWNSAKEAAHLSTAPSTGSRLGGKPNGVDVSEDEWAAMSVDQRWHYRNVEWNTTRTLNRRARLRQWVNEHKRQRGCTRCGVDDVACLDFHHVDPSEKNMAVGKLITHGYRTDRLREEMAGCEVLCANCHRREHTSPATDGIRGWVAEYKASRGCNRCGERDPICLDCHHVGEKGETVARLLADGRPADVVREEVANCVILCANCHRNEHYEPPTASRKPTPQS